MASSRDTFDSGSFRGVASFRSGLVDHRMARRHLINEYHRGRLGREEVCDAHPELMRAARGVGKQTETRCPICVESNLVLVTYVFGPRLAAHGKVVADNNELAQFHRRTEEYTAYVVEACCSCRWHHLVRVLPIGGQRANRRVG
ncbi:MAG: hypothetical protein RLZ19_656 [Actinomycetota bacterium]|jgi:hypothetical protein